MGEGDTRGAKDVSDKIDNEDQLLGAQQKDQQEEEQQQQNEEQGQEDNEDKVRGGGELCIDHSFELLRAGISPIDAYVHLCCLCAAWGWVKRARGNRM